jgi:hypothetical protein
MPMRIVADIDVSEIFIINIIKWPHKGF